MYSRRCGNVANGNVSVFPEVAAELFQSLVVRGALKTVPASGAIAAAVDVARPTPLRT